MDKSWVSEPRFSPRYIAGVNQFMEFVIGNFGKDKDVRCPCAKCLNAYTLSQREVKDHLLIKGFMRTYTHWIHHGESRGTGINTSNDNYHNMMAESNEENDELLHMLDDLRSEHFANFRTEEDSTSTFSQEEGYFDPFDELLKDYQRELYPGCRKLSTLSFVVKILHLKVYLGISNKGIDMLLDLFREALPPSASVPNSHYDAMSMLRKLGLGYTTIHACQYDCALFWGEYENEEYCPECKTSRWKLNDGKGKKIPHKILRYFPITPRLKRLYMSRKTADDMRWHYDKRVNDENILRHPADSKAWKDFDRKHEWFAKEPRNIRLGLATDGFNPFGNQNTNYSMWPVIVMPYNLPPWTAMNDTNFILSLLIPGPTGPGKDIDVFLRPLIDELKRLWNNGVQTYDASSQQTFQMHAAVLWTVNDFPAYGSLSGWSTKGYKACPTCNEDTDSTRIRSKICYINHRRFLPHNHSWRRNGKMFNGKREHRSRPRRFSGEDRVKQLLKLPNIKPGKHPSNEYRKRKRAAMELNWTRIPILYELPYWKTLLLPHNLDVMHIEKNILDNILNTLFNVPKKTKDTLKAREDLRDMGIRKELWLQKSGDKYQIPPACYTLSVKERQEICEFLRTVKLPDGYASNISRCVSVENVKISGLKSHDCHVLLQRILPVALRGYVSKDLYSVLVELGNFFQQLCCPTLNVEVLKKMEADIAIILCKLEKIFPPAFFDIMEHLPIHLPGEAILGGPVNERWMFPIERHLKHLKSNVRNKARAEGSIAEAFIAEESLTFCSMYLNDIETRFNRAERNDDHLKETQVNKLLVFSKVRPLGAIKLAEMTRKDLDTATWYVLNNCWELERYFEVHKKKLLEQGCSNIEERHRLEFPKWFKSEMCKLYHQKAPEATDELYALACGPDRRARHFTGCIVNGVRFHTKDRDARRKCQNSSLVVEGEHNDKAMDFYGTLTDIVELQYIKGCRVVLFKCQWFNSENKRTAIQNDGYFTSINITRTWYDNDPFVLASQAKQIFYLNDTLLGKNWRVVQKFQTRSVFDVPEQSSNSDDQDELVQNNVYQETEPTFIGISEGVIDHEEELLRTDIEPECVSADVVQSTIGLAKDDLIEDDSDEEDDTLAEYCDNGEEEATQCNDEDSDDGYDK